jgi:hypothetical protein
MPKFNQENIVAARELEQLVSDYFAALDSDIESRDVTPYFTEDCIVDIGAITYKGRAAMKAFYAQRAADVQGSKEGARTRRHAVTNMRISFKDKTHATLIFLNVTFSGSGKAPILTGAAPTIVTDIRMECRADTNGDWLIAEFYGAPVFVGNDGYMNKTVVGK